MGHQQVETVKVSSAAAVEGLYGPQWQLEAQYPWSKFPTRAWIDRRGDTPPPPGEYPCLLEQGALRAAQDGTPKTGEFQWDYNWRIIEFDTKRAPILPNGANTSPVPDVSPQSPEPAPAKQRPTPQPSFADQADERRASIEHQVALKAAIDFLALPGAAEGTLDNALTAATAFYDWLQGSAPTPRNGVYEDEDAPQSASSPGGAPESAEAAHARGTDEMLGAEAPPTIGRAAFMSAALKHLSYGVDDVTRILEISQPSEITNLGDAWTKLEEHAQGR